MLVSPIGSITLALLQDIKQAKGLERFIGLTWQ
jgi:hypothetical protein